MHDRIVSPANVPVVCPKWNTWNRTVLGCGCKNPKSIVLTGEARRGVEWKNQKLHRNGNDLGISNDSCLSSLFDFILEAVCTRIVGGVMGSLGRYQVMFQMVFIFLSWCMGDCPGFWIHSFCLCCAHTNCLFLAAIDRPSLSLPPLAPFPPSPFFSKFSRWKRKILARTRIKSLKALSTILNVLFSTYSTVLVNNDTVSKTKPTSTQQTAISRLSIRNRFETK